MKATQQQYLQCVEIYNASGVSGVCDYAAKNGIDSWSLCDPCETKTPDTDDNCCLVCGTLKEINVNILKLNSNAAVSAPGVFMWAKQLWATAANDKDRETAIQILSSWDSGLTDEQLSQVLSGQIKTEIDKETVLIHVGE